MTVRRYIYHPPPEGGGFPIVGALMLGKRVQLYHAKTEAKLTKLLDAGESEIVKAEHLDQSRQRLHEALGLKPDDDKAT